MIFAIFLYISCVYNEIFTRPNCTFTRLGRVDIDFIYLWCEVWDGISSSHILLGMWLFIHAGWD